MAGDLPAYASALVFDWYGERHNAEMRIERRADGEVPVFVASGGGSTLALAIAPLWEPGVANEAARATMEERLSAGLVRGPHLLWIPPGGTVPIEEPDASEFVQRVQQAAGPLQAGARAEVRLPVALHVAKMRAEGGYASVIGGLSRWWTHITERVDGTVQVNSMAMRRAPQSAIAREALFDVIAQAARGLQVGEATRVDAEEAWTVQRLRSEPLAVTGFAIAQAPADADLTDGTTMRRLVRARLRAASEALAGVQADAKGVALVAIYDFAEHENLGAFVKSLDPALWSPLALVAAVVDGDVRAIFEPRRAS